MCCILLILDTSILILYSRSSSMPVVAVVVVLWFAVPSAFEFELGARKLVVYICKRLFILLNTVRFSSNLEGILDGTAFLASTQVSPFSQLISSTVWPNSDGQKKLGHKKAQIFPFVLKSIVVEEHPLLLSEAQACFWFLLEQGYQSSRRACLG